jgi:hypothetical protein
VHALRCAIENEVNEVIFRKPACKSNWRFPLQDNGTMGTIKFANWRAQRVVEHFSNLVDQCIIDEVEREKWKEVFSSYSRKIQVHFFLKLSNFFLPFLLTLKYLLLF